MSGLSRDLIEYVPTVDECHSNTIYGNLNKGILSYLKWYASVLIGTWYFKDIVLCIKLVSFSASPKLPRWGGGVN